MGARSSHGTLVAVQITPGGAFTTIAELGDVTLPELFKNEFDATVQNRNIDDYVHGVPRRSVLTVPVNFLPGDTSHIGLQTLFWAGTTTGFRVSVPAAGSDPGTIWIASGEVQRISPTAPVDGKLAANITIRFSGVMLVDGVTFGA